MSKPHFSPKHHGGGPAPEVLSDDRVRRHLERLDTNKAWALVRSAGHALPHDAMVRSEVERLVSERAVAVVNSPDGDRQIEERVQQVIQQRVTARLSSPAFAEALRSAFVAAAGKEARAHDEQLAALCRQAVDREVTAWLDSPQGRESFEELLAQAMDEKICQAEALRRLSWITLRLRHLGRPVPMEETPGA